MVATHPSVAPAHSSTPKSVYQIAERLRSFSFAVLGVLIFLPSATFSVVAAEVFPWALIFCLAFGKRVNKWVLAASVYLVCSAIVGQLVVAEQNVPELARSLGAYVNSLLILGVVAASDDHDTRVLLKIGRRVFYGLVTIGLLQFLGVFGFAQELVQWMVPRASAEILAERGGRGVTLLATEPARAGIELVSIYLVARLSVKTERGRLLSDLALGLFMLVVIRSAQAMAFYCAFIAIFYHYRLLKILPLMVVAIWAILSQWEVDARVVLLVRDVFEQATASDIFYLLSNNSGHRLTSIISNYSYGITHPFGGGIGNWHVSSVVALKESGLDLTRLNYFNLFGNGEAVSIRASGYITNLILDIGIVGIVPVMYALHRVFQRLNAYTGLALPITLLFIAKICIFGSVGNPVAWIAVALCLKSIDLGSAKA